MKFIGRDSERKKMHRLLKKTGQSVTLVFGRRRVGKSELIKQVLKEEELNSLYYECKQTTELNNAESLSALISEKFNLPKLALGGIESVLDFLFEKACETPLLLVLDEYPYLCGTVKGMDSILQSLIDKFHDHSSLKLILCGSYVDVMKSLLLRENPLYGRVDLTIDLKPMDYFDSAQFYSSFSDEDKIRLYSVFGGIPYYNRLIDPELSVRDNIIDLIASPGARLENEVSMYLKSEISKMENANEVFETLAQGFSKFSDILSQSHVSSSPSLAAVLDRLIRMEVVQKTAPINDENNKKKAGYSISDNLSLFFYRYIFHYASQLRVMDEQIFFDRYISEHFESNHVPKIFEEVCRQYLIRQNKKGALPEIFEKIGKYYYDDPIHRKNGEFDIVTRGTSGYTFYEAKFRKDPISKKMIDDEIQQVKATGLNCNRFGFFSRSGFTMDWYDDATQLISLKELFSDN